MPGEFDRLTSFSRWESSQRRESALRNSQVSESRKRSSFSM